MRLDSRCCAPWMVTAQQVESLSQSLPIIEFLDEVFPELPLIPKADPVKRAHVRRIAEIVNSGEYL